MWKLLEQAAKNASANASGYVSSVHEKAQSLAAAVQDEASTLLSAIGTAHIGPVDEILYEELAAYREFADFFSAEEHTNEIATVMAESEEVREMHEAMVPVELSYEEFWCRLFFRQQQAEERSRRDQERRRALLQEQKQEANKAAELAPGLESDEDDDTDDVDGDEKVALAGDDEHPPEQWGDQFQPPLSPPAGQKREKSGSEDQEGVWLLRAARDTERRSATQWRQKARELHRQLQVAKQERDEQAQKALKDWEDELQTLCDTYESKMAETTLQIDEARAAGYDEGVRESQAVVESVKQSAEEDMARLRAEMAMCQSHEPSNAVLASEKVAALIKEKSELEQKLQVSMDRVRELEKQTPDDSGSAQTDQSAQALAEMAKEKDLWRMRALKMKKLKDLIQTELTNLKQGVAGAATETEQKSSDSSEGSAVDAKLQTRVTELQNQLANALASAEMRAREAYEKGVAAGKTDAEQRVKQEREQAYDDAYKRAQAEVKSEMGVLRAELGMFRAFHESAVHAADDEEEKAPGCLPDDSLDELSLADGAPLCSPTSSVSIFTDNGKSDFGAPELAKATDDWGEW